MFPRPSSSTDSILVKVGAGVTFASLLSIGSKSGWSVAVIGSTTVQTVVGAVCTAVHNSHRDIGSICGCVEELEIVRMPRDDSDEPETMWCSRTSNSDLFLSVLSGLGAVAVITSVVLRLRPNTTVRITQGPESLSSLLSIPSPSPPPSSSSSPSSSFHCKSLLGQRVLSSRYYKLWWWASADRVIEWRAEEVEEEGTRLDCWLVQPHWLYQLLYGLWFWLLESMYALSNLTASTRIAGLANWMWYEALLSRRVVKQLHHTDAFSFDCMFRQEVMEWAIAQDVCVDVLRHLATVLRDHPQWTLHPPIEIRFTSADEAWLSPSYGRESCWIGVVMYRAWGTNPPAYWRDFLRVFNNIMSAAGGRPHWAKFKPKSLGSGRELKRMYPMYAMWTEVRDVMDPTRMLVTPFVDKILNEDN
eukprot:GHVS01074684.1.p1 GENE.GHVS01074684.1~~GHVS01074684.1.p1  ORF type:complete len:433 (-),score=102.59 GHVS01074684.1:231-1478(-)